MIQLQEVTLPFALAQAANLALAKVGQTNIA
jgi:hypothetical protein